MSCSDFSRREARFPCPTSERGAASLPPAAACAEQEEQTLAMLLLLPGDPLQAPLGAISWCSPWDRITQCLRLSRPFPIDPRACGCRVCLDLSKAFGTVSYSVLLEELPDHGLDGRIHCWEPKEWW